MKTNYSNGKFRWFCQSKRAALPIQSPSVKGVAPKLLKNLLTIVILFTSCGVKVLY